VNVRTLTVGPLQENCHVLSTDDGRALMVDPGDEPDRLLASVDGLALEAILLTHCHFDHVGAVAPVARATGAPVWCPELEAPVLRDINAYVPFPGLGPFEPHEPEELLRGGEVLELAGFTLDVLATPGHSPGHLTFSVRGEDVLLSGDVLFQGSIGRTDLPGGDTRTLLRSIATLLERFGDETVVLPGHMGTTTLGAERATNPFLTALAS
jgi:glyoxylase-like metal-dependent hydrolase (beta-lactamase superfamily II)